VAPTSLRPRPFRHNRVQALAIPSCSGRSADDGDRGGIKVADVIIEKRRANSHSPNPMLDSELLFFKLLLEMEVK
jgi:hypothetical protein